MALLRTRPASPMDPHPAQLPQPAPAARAETLPNSLPALLLDHARPLALSVSCSVSHHIAIGSGVDYFLLAEPHPVTLALFGTPVGHRSPRSASHRLRPRD